MTRLQEPPARKSISQWVMLDPSHPHQCLRCSGVVHASNNNCARRWKRQVNAISRSEGRLTATSTLFPTSMFPSSFCFQLSQILVESVHAVFPGATILIKPFVNVPQRSTLQT